MTINLSKNWTSWHSDFGNLRYLDVRISVIHCIAKSPRWMDHPRRRQFRQVFLSSWAHWSIPSCTASTTSDALTSQFPLTPPTGSTSCSQPATPWQRCPRLCKIDHFVMLLICFESMKWHSLMVQQNVRSKYYIKTSVKFCIYYMTHFLTAAPGQKT